MSRLVLAMVLTSVAMALAGGDAPRTRLARRLPTLVPDRRWHWPLTGALGLLLAGVLVLREVAGRPHLAVLGLVAAGVVMATVRLVARSRTRAAESSRRGQVIELCDALVAELRAGRPPPAALAAAARDFPELAGLATRATAGADVADLLRAHAHGGAEQLAALAAGWEVASHAGAGLADVLDRLSTTLRDLEDVRLEVAAALGPPRATARLLAVLPLVGALLGTGLGGHPVTILLGSMLGALCLAGGAAASVVGLFWVERIATQAEL